MKSKPENLPSFYWGVPTFIASGYSLIASIAIVAILAFFVDALRRESMSIPWPLLLIMAASFFNAFITVYTSFSQLCLPRSPMVPLILYAFTTILWVAAISALGDQLGEHLSASCPSETVFGKDMALVCHLYKAVFGISISCAAVSAVLVIRNVFAWKRLGRAGKYTAVHESSDGRSPSSGGSERNTLSEFASRMRKRKGEGRVKEEERGFMMGAMKMPDDDALKPRKVSDEEVLLIAPGAPSNYGEGKLQSKQLNDFHSKKVPETGNTSAVLYGSYVYFEKMRVKEGKPKSKHREDMERMYKDEGGINIKERPGGYLY
ncbi:hypothetical protein BCR34DRAFT_598839 [Clohesyomyces aquaticus]|uniref:MARVEL domain-containing protein n=1 Tax=Clohesyomyces aquaticus TaxID=1231657 RepID=A0A1Y1ZXF6_9PLEO|nr:hypothetical protein BCR34DRAFT_598839 [Clohesyomyces aquaticus]